MDSNRARVTFLLELNLQVVQFIARELKGNAQQGVFWGLVRGAGRLTGTGGNGSARRPLARFDQG